MSSAPIAEFRQFDLALDKFAILAGPIVSPLAAVA